MKLSVALIILLFASVELLANIDSLMEVEYIRSTFYEAIEEEKKLDELVEYLSLPDLEKRIAEEPILMAYFGMAEALKSKHAFWPFSKFSYFLDSMDILEVAVRMDPDNLEIRFLRFSVLHHVPGILGYSEEMEDDLKRILLLLEENDFREDEYDLINNVKDFLIYSERLTEEQLSKIRVLRE